MMCWIMVLHNVIGENKLGSNIPHLTRKGRSVAEGAVEREGGTRHGRQIQVSSISDAGSWGDSVRRSGWGSGGDALVAKRGERNGSSSFIVGDGTCRLGAGYSGNFAVLVNAEVGRTAGIVIATDSMVIVVTLAGTTGVAFRVADGGGAFVLLADIKTDTRHAILDHVIVEIGIPRCWKSLLLMVVGWGRVGSRCRVGNAVSLSSVCL